MLVAIETGSMPTLSRYWVNKSLETRFEKRSGPARRHAGVCHAVVRHALADATAER
jgi:hypothetical protein